MTRAERFTHPARLPLVCPSILSADFTRLGADCEAVLRAGGDSLHLDVMDGHFVPNLTMGPALCRSLRRALPDAHMDVHLMVTDPAKFVEPFADAGADHLTFHVEAVEDPDALAHAIRERGLTAGIAISPPTPLARIEPWIDSADLVLVMTVNPGFAGQAFIGDALRKAEAIAGRLRPEQRLQADGGVNPSTAIACRAAGIDTLVAASAIFGSDDWGATVLALRGEGCAATGERR